MDEIMNPATPEEEQPEQNAPVSVVDVMFRSGGKVYFFDPDGMEIPNGAHVIIDTARGIEYGTCVGTNHTVRNAEVVAPLRKVLRIATGADERMAEEYREKEKRAFDICQKKIAEQGLDMQLVSAEYAFDGSKALFFFTADERVDFRELVKSLASALHTRIELRQIGVRDKAKMVGGLGVCGRPFCCSEFLADFQPVSIKMAKVQNLSLNPTKISGTCGRLMCCLKYEQEAYEELLRESPRNESFVDTPDGRGTVTEVNLLRQSVKVRMEDHPEEINCYHNCDICVLRNGKAHRNDPPIPKDLAPISGNRERQTKLQSTAPDYEPLAPIVFRSEKETAAEPAEEPKQSMPRRKKRSEDKPAAQEQPQEPRRPRRRSSRGNRPEADKAKPARAEGSKPQKPQHTESEKAQAEAQKSESPRPAGEKPHRTNRNRNRRYYRRKDTPRDSGQS